jgi:hypothetical protein
LGCGAEENVREREEKGKRESGNSKRQPGDASGGASELITMTVGYWHG